MANTGKEIVLTLKQVYLPCPPCDPVGPTKANTPGEEDYIAPYINLTNCPVTADTTCPYFLATGGTGQVEYEFSVPDSVLANTSIASIKIQLGNSDGSIIQQETNYTFPMSPSTTYKSAIFTSVTAGVHQMNAVYLDSSNNVVATCLNVDTITST